MRSVLRLAALFVGLQALAVQTAPAQDLETFYKAQTIKIIVGSPPGGSYDLYARAMSRHFGRHLPGQPAVIVQNMPGGGGYAAANHLFNNAARDGTVIATFSRSVPMQPLIDDTGVHFDARKFGWVGSPSDEVGAVLTWHTSAVKTYDDLRKNGMVVAATGPGTDSNVYPRVLSNVLGLSIKSVTGYTGAADMLLAVQRGEADGAAGISWSSLWPAQKALIEENKFNLILQLGLKSGPAPQLKGVPVIMDLVKNEDDRRVLDVIFARQSMAYPFAAPPEVPADRLAALRAAFDATMADPQFLAETRTTGMEVHPVSHQDMTAIIERVYSSSPALIERVKASMDLATKK